MADIIIKNGTLITVDPERRVIEKGAIAIEKDKITAVGTTRQVTMAHKAKKVIDAKGMAVMPGLIDTYGNSASALMKNIGEHISGASWRRLKDFIFPRCTSHDYWHVEGQLVGLERLKFGTTCFVHRFATAPFGEDMSHAEANMNGIAEVGLRHVISVGAPRPPFPSVSSKWKNGKRYDKIVSLEECFKAAGKTIDKCNGRHEGRTNVWVGVSRFHAPTATDPMFKPEFLELSQRQAVLIKKLMDTYGVGLHANAYGGVVEWCREKLDILGPKVLLCHCTSISPKEINYLSETDTKVSHCPTAVRAYTDEGGCPVVELIDKGVCVSLGSDYTGTTRTGDQFKDMKIALILQRQRFRDTSFMPPGKLIEMVTIDGARALGMDHIIGSLETGKKADIILINMEQPHLKPIWMIPQRIVYQVTGHDVDTVIVDGRILMQERKVKSLNEKRVMARAQKEGELMVERSSVYPLMGLPDRFWGHSRY